MYDKQTQLKKSKKINDKRLDAKKYKLKCQWLFDTYPKCQVCLVNDSNDAHHVLSGAYKDDRTIISICRYPCHHNIHFGQYGIDISKDELLKIGKSNHEEWLTNKD